MYLVKSLMYEAKVVIKMSDDETYGVLLASRILETEGDKDTLKPGESDFTTVKSRRTRRKGDHGSRSILQVIKHETKEPLENILNRPVTEKKHEILKKVNYCIEKLRDSEYYSKFVDKVRQGFENVTGFHSIPERLHIYCLGLGPFSSHLLARVARYQLGLLLLLKDEFGASAEIFDPVFMPQEKAILVEDFEFQVSEINEEGKHPIESSTIIFMPHCPHQLVNNFLYANWNPDSLQKCFIICNSVSEAVHTISPKYVNDNLSFILKAHSICTELPIQNIFKHQPDIFNDLSLHIFPPNKFTNISEDFWSDISCPVYSEYDFILSK